MGMSGSKVWDHYIGGDIVGIRNYCETDVLNTYLVYLRFELIRGHLSQTRYEQLCTQVRTSLEQEDQPHLHAFLHNWNPAVTA
jgi:predicted PolB exonuclease-like 3'-5' exonuclease